MYRLYSPTTDSTKIDLEDETKNIRKSDEEIIQMDNENSNQKSGIHPEIHNTKDWNRRESNYPYFPIFLLILLILIILILVSYGQSVPLMTEERCQLLFAFTLGFISNNKSPINSKKFNYLIEFLTLTLTCFWLFNVFEMNVENYLIRYLIAFVISTIYVCAKSMKMCCSLHHIIIYYK